MTKWRNIEFLCLLKTIGKLSIYNITYNNVQNFFVYMTDVQPCFLSTCYGTSQKNTNGLRAGAQYKLFRVEINTLAKMYA